MYKQYQDILQKNYIRSKRRKESLSKRNKTEKFGSKYSLTKCENLTQVLEKLNKNDILETVLNQNNPTLQWLEKKFANR